MNFSAVHSHTSCVCERFSSEKKVREEKVVVAIPPPKQLWFDVLKVFFCFKNIFLMKRQQVIKSFCFFFFFLQMESEQVTWKNTQSFIESHSRVAFRGCVCTSFFPLCFPLVCFFFCFCQRATLKCSKKNKGLIAPGAFCESPWQQAPQSAGCCVCMCVLDATPPFKVSPWLHHHHIYPFIPRCCCWRFADRHRNRATDKPRL